MKGSDVVLIICSCNRGSSGFPFIMDNLTGEMSRSAVIKGGDLNGALRLQELRQVIKYGPFTCTMIEEPRGEAKTPRWRNRRMSRN